MGKNKISNERGSSLLEILAAIAVIGIISANSGLSFKDIHPSFKKWDARSQIVHDLRLAQATALTEGCRVIFEINVNADGYSIGCDYVPYSDPVVSDVVFETKLLPRDITMSANTGIIFNSRGQIIDVDGSLDSVFIRADFGVGGIQSEFMSAEILATGTVIID